MASKSPSAGGWPSPITADLISGSTISIAQVLADRADGSLYHLESRPSEKGRVALVFDGDGSGPSKGQDSDSSKNVRSRVHEYGGGAATVSQGVVYFSDFGGGVYKTSRKGDWTSSELVVPENAAFRYADFSVHPRHPDLVCAVREDHRKPSIPDVVNELVLLDTKAKKVTVLVTGADFYAAGRWSADGEWLTWLSWEHPDMPWTGSQLHAARFNVEKRSIVESSRRKLAGSLGSVSQPRWNLDGTLLFFLGDKSGYSQLYSVDVAAVPEAPKLVIPPEEKYDQGQPDWLLDQSTYAVVDSSKVVTRTSAGVLTIFDAKTSSRHDVKLPYRGVSDIRALSPTVVAFVARSDAKPTALVTMDFGQPDQPTFRTVKQTTTSDVDETYISAAEEIEFPAPGKSGQTAFAWFYPPKSKDYQVGSEKPPVILRCHGGPTSAAAPGLDWVIQYYTSRGFAFADVNYGGSTGYGREYRDRLQGEWGVVDVDDTVACVKYLAEQGRAHPKKAAIIGGSSGGFTVLAAMCAHSEVFGAGASSYGIADLSALALDTHKFESQYLFGLVGGTPEEVPKVYHDRSPINNVSDIRCPLLVLQGADDKVVPPEQSEMIVKAVEKNGGKVEYVLFEGEGHGFRQAANIKRAVEKHLSFFQETFGIATA